MAWPVWVFVTSIALLAGTLIGLWRRRGRYLDKPNLEARKGSSLEGHKEPELAVAPGKPHAQRHPVEEAITDSLTSVKTRYEFMEALEREWQRSSHLGCRFCLAMVDLDRFRHVNDRIGRLEGDKVLTTVGTLLGARSRHSNLVARYGGDEFAILMPDSNALQAEVLTERLRSTLEEDAVLRAHEVTVSIGIAAFPDHGRTPEEILQMADYGVHLAKQCGGNCVKVAWLSPKPEDAERDKRLLEAYLEKAEIQLIPSAPDAGNGGSGTTPTSAIQMSPLLGTVTALAFAVEAKGPYRRDHSQAVSRLAAQMALQTGLPWPEIEEIRLAGLVHDIGKIHVPDRVLKKPTLLTPEEFEIMKSHAAWGAKMLELLNVKAIEHIVLHHHERYDGKGYPHGLAGDEIPLGARIVAVAESFHNMVSDLRYKSPRTFEDALAELRRCSGTQFDPQVVTTFLEWLQFQAT
ncbi:MAG TPA: diguanylate cyclase [Terriglobia bacterium]|nr:diguanylate cyclase [Terriglobia bacterium]